jgi:subtilisin-like proprotein convertase family protein
MKGTNLVKSYPLRTRLSLVLLASLLAAPIAPIVAPLGAKNRSRTVTRTFHNPASIPIPTSDVSPVSASRYPSPIEVSGLKGRIRDVNVRLHNFQHTDPDDVQVLLVGPRGQTAIMMADAGGNLSVTNVTLTLDDEAGTPLPAPTGLQSGTFRPTNANELALDFNDPAPEVSANAALSVFDGGSPNGTWRLFVQDDNADFDPGVVAGGWALEITAKAKKHKKRR